MSLSKPSLSKHKQLKRLADAMADGRATGEDAALLSQLLRDDPQAQDAYLAYIDVHAQLSWEFRGGENVRPPARVVETAESGWWNAMLLLGLGVVAAGLVAVAGMMIFSPVGQDSTRAKNQAEQPVTFCRLTQKVGAHWDAASPLQVGDRLGSRRLKLETGLAEVTFDNGIRTVLAGPAELELIDSMHAYLHGGRVVFHVPQSAIGFTLETTEAEVIDLGTEFGVHSGQIVGTELQVYQGEVVAEAKADPQRRQSQRLQGGQAVRFAKGGASLPEEIHFWPDRFVRYLPDPNDPDAPRDRSRRKVSPYNQARHEEIHILPAPDNVTIDGDLADWDLRGQFASRCEPPYDSFYHVEGAMMYDDEFLYIGANVGDPFPMRSTVSPHEERTLYGNGGCLAFRIATDREMGWPVRGEGPGTTYARQLVPEDYNEKLVFLVLWYYEPETLPCLHVKYGMDQHGRKINPPGYQGAFRKHEDGWGYTAEYAIPWSLLSAADNPPRGGDVLGCTWLVHWAGPEGRNWKGQLIDVVNPAVDEWNFQNAGTWGRAIYHARNPRAAKTLTP